MDQSEPMGMKDIGALTRYISVEQVQQDQGATATANMYAHKGIAEVLLESIRLGTSSHSLLGGHGKQEEVDPRYGIVCRYVV